MASKSLATILLVVEDSDRASELLRLLELRGYSIEWVISDEQAINGLASNQFDVVLTELHSPRIDGFRVLSVARDRNPTMPVIFLTEPDQTALALQALDSGASAYHEAPFTGEVVHRLIEQGLERQSLQYEIFQLKRHLDTRHGLPSLVGQSGATAALHDRVRESASGTMPIIIIGESGTGRDHLARTIHNQSARSRRPFVKVSFDENNRAALERSLFGHGADVFADAPEGLAGQVEYADEGTLYLDDLRDLSPLQKEQLIACLESHEVQRFGESRRISVDLRVVVSITAPLDANDPTSDFLDVLQHQFGGISLEVPALRDRPEDIALLIRHFIEVHSEAQNKSVAGIDADVIQLLSQYGWPGNIRELENAIQQMVLGAEDGERLRYADVPVNIRQHPELVEDEIRIPAGSSMGEAERIMILETMRACDGDKNACAKSLKIGLRTLYRKLSEYDTSD